MKRIDVFTMQPSLSGFTQSMITSAVRYGPELMHHPHGEFTYHPNADLGYRYHAERTYDRSYLVIVKPVEAADIDSEQFARYCLERLVRQECSQPVTVADATMALIRSQRHVIVSGDNIQRAKQWISFYDYIFENYLIGNLKNSEFNINLGDRLLIVEYNIEG